MNLLLNYLKIAILVKGVIITKPSYSNFFSFCNQQVVDLGICRKGVSSALSIILLECAKLDNTKLRAHCDRHDIRFPI